MKCKTKNREKSMNQEDNSSKVKTFAQQMTLGRRWKGKLCDRRNYTHLTKDSYLVYTKNPQNNKIREMETDEWLSEVRNGGGEGECVIIKK